MPHAGNYIYSGFVPLLKMAITILCGFILGKKGILPQAASRAASYVAMNVSLPCLIFASVVSAFSKDNISSLGPLCMNAIIYQLAGLVMGWLIRECLYVPADFQWGILAACTWSNWGNLPIAVITTIATQSPFDKNVDPTLGTAYVAVFTLIYNVTFFGMGGCKICAWDFRPGADEVVPVRERWSRRRQACRRVLNALRSRRKLETPSTLAHGDMPLVDLPLQAAPSDTPDLEKGKSAECKTFPGKGEARPSGYISVDGSASPAIVRYRSHQEVISIVQSLQDTIQVAPVSSRSSHSRVIIPGREYDVPEDAVPRIRDAQDETGRKRSNLAQASSLPHKGAPEADGTQNDVKQDEPAHSPWYRVPLGILKLTLTPPSISLFLALPISLVQPLKALFVHVEGWTGGRIPNSPDGKPPLSWVLDTASFLGQICIPLGLILLGASFARLKLPKPLSRLPIAAIAAVTVAKMVILPIIGVLMTEGLSKHTSLYPRDQKMLSFVAMFLAGTPSAANQSLITAIYSPDGNIDTLSAFFALQYAFMFISSTALAAVALAIVA